MAVGTFCIDYQSGRVATRKQLVTAGLTDADGQPQRPWHPIQGPSDASTMWYSVLRKRERGIFIGTLCIRQPERLASLLEAGWEEIPVADISAEG